MDKVIPFNKGIRRQPSLGEAGELSECVNLIPQNGELVNVRGISKYYEFSDNGTLLCVHRVNNLTNYVIKKSDRHVLFLLSDKSGYNKNELDVGEGVKILKAQTVGNIVIIICHDGMIYLRWNGEEYINLGNGIPHMEASFFTECRHRDSYAYTTISYGDNLKTSLKDVVQPLYMSKLNDFSRSYFINPFFVKVGYRLYDGTFFDCSPHILIPCTTKFPMLAELYDRSGTLEGGGTWNLQIRFRLYWHRLRVSCSLTDQDKEKVRSFKDIIKSVCVFISPLQLGGDEIFSEWGGYESTPETKIHGRLYGNSDFTGYTLFKRADTIPSFVCINRHFEEEVTTCSNFYLLKEYKLDYFLSIIDEELNGNDEFTDTDLGKYEDLDLRPLAITSRERLETDTVNNKVSCDVIFNYNRRLILGGLKRYLYSDVSPNIFFPYLPYTNYSNFDIPEAYVLIEKEGKQYVARLNRSFPKKQTNVQQSAYYLFYPDANAKEIVIGKNGMYFKTTLIRHPILDGAYAYNGMSELFSNRTGSDIPKMDTEEYYPQSNGIYSTKADNPFYIDLISLVQVGDGEVRGFSNVAKAISQGQFGQFPLYVFCSDGIWSLEIADDGTFKSKQPVSRDICNNPESITQIDGAVVFTTDQGLKLIQGSDVVLLSGHLEGHNVDENVYFKKTEDGTGFFAKYNLGEFDKLINPESRDIRDIFRTCSIAYDYVNQLLRIFPKREDGADTKVPYKYYVYSFTTNEFATVIGNEFDNGNGEYNEVTTVVPDYPSSIVQIGSKLYRPMETEREGLQDGLILTRPLTLDEPFALKKLQDMRLNYSKFKGDSKCRVVLYVSNDGREWKMINSFRGGAYKYFRIAVATKLTDADALTGAVIRYDLERTNKLR